VDVVTIAGLLNEWMNEFHDLIRPASFSAMRVESAILHATAISLHYFATHYIVAFGCYCHRHTPGRESNPCRLSATMCSMYPRQFPPYPKTISSTLNLRTRQAVVIRQQTVTGFKSLARIWMLCQIMDLVPWAMGIKQQRKGDYQVKAQLNST
jgi:hypothetical protein